MKFKKNHLTLLLMAFVAVITLGYYYYADDSANNSNSKTASVKEMVLKKDRVEGKRLALVIGNHQYQRLSKLPNAGRDADAMAGALQDAGFAITKAKDLTYTAMVDVVEDFLKKINKGDDVVVFFSGHGVQIPNQGGYLLPVDTISTSAGRVAQTAQQLDDLMARFAKVGPRFSMFIVDACRDNPFATKGVGTGFANPDPAKGQIVLFAASRNQQALEKLSYDDKDPNGVFTREFIKRMKTPGLEISVLMKDVQNSVEALAATVNHEQRPAYVNEARGDFYFFGPSAAQLNAANGTTPEALELQYWQSTERQNTKDAYLLYKKRYAKGQFVELADAALARIAKDEAALVEQVQRPTSPNVQVTQVQVDQRAPAATIIAAAPALAPVSSGPDQVLKDCADCPEMIVIPSGSFLMGSPDNEKDRDANEGPQRTVSIKSFAMGKTEVTQGQYKAIMGINPSYFKDCGDDCPVEQISWSEAQEFIKKLNAKTGKKYRLPSESEWEYAARAGTSTPYVTGSAISTMSANFDGVTTSGAFRGKTTPVTVFKSNAYGLHDMHGNVMEWVEDSWRDNYANATPDGSSWILIGSQRRVLRGGSWNNTSKNIRSAKRFKFLQSIKDPTVGFRLVRLI